MNPTASSLLRSNPSDPFSQELPRDMVLRLLSASFTARDYQCYLKTRHWLEMRRRVFEARGPPFQLLTDLEKDFVVEFLEAEELPEDEGDCLTCNAVLVKAGFA